MNQNVGILLIHGFATGFITTWLGLLLVNIRPKLKEIMFVGFCYAIINIVVRSIDITMGIQFCLLTILLVTIVMLNWNLGFLRSLLIVILGTIVMALGENLSMSLIYRLTPLTWEYEQAHPLVSLVLPTPQIVIALIIIWFCLKTRKYIFDFSSLDYSIPNEKRVRVIVVLASTMLFLLLIQIVFNILYGLSAQYIMPNVSTQGLSILPTMAMVCAFLIMVLIIQQLFILLGKESKYITQTAYVQTLDELYTATQAEAHDRINHLQTLYGFVQLGNLDETRAYLEELIGEIIVTRNFMSTGHPALSALLYIKSGLATSRGIQLDITADTRVDKLAIPPHELNRILGNLINNAFDSVAMLPREDRKVFVHITKNDKKYQIRIANCGNLTPEAQQKIFERGFSTKRDGHRGLGLFIVRQLVEKHRGQVEVDNPDGMVVFTVYLPESSQGSEAIEQPGSKSRSFNSGEFNITS
ncbi:MAG: GHKL domain-containing protein [Syntrophomonadaceae bacterium]|nr:GHKL domain-containing protein [Syntrophomonadaceae bacterium]